MNESEGYDQVQIVGTEGRITFGIFDHFDIGVEKKGQLQTIPFEKIAHVQQPMIEKVVEYFSGGETNPCPPEVGVQVMEMMESFTLSQRKH